MSTQAHTTVTISTKVAPDLAARVARLAEAEDRTPSSVIRRALRAYFDSVDDEHEGTA